MRKFYTLLLISFLSGFAYSQSPEVPHTILFADHKLKLTPEAQKVVQGYVNNLTKYPKYFNIKVEKLRIYFPIIEQIFRDENIPDDFKYLIIQESAFIPDAVSTSNAVGYWQFKRESAMEVGMRVDNEIDERMNIVAATRGAAKYFKRNNFYLNNWVHTLLSYNLGLGGAKLIVNLNEAGAEWIDITENNHVYVLKFLAHKIAFQEYCNNYEQSRIQLFQYTQGAEKNLNQISAQFELNNELMKHYNLWAKTSFVPVDKTYTVIIPAEIENKEKIIASLYPKSNVVINEPKIAVVSNKSAENANKDTKEYHIETTNKLKSIIASIGEDQNNVALRGSITREKLIKYNDLYLFDEIIPGQIYYLESKRSKASVEYHIAEEGEDLWQVSQRYGIKLQNLQKFNRMSKFEQLQAGRVLWMLETRPKSIPVEIRKIRPKKTIEAIAEKPKEEKQEIKTEKQIEAKPMVHTAPVIEKQAVYPGENTAKKVEPTAKEHTVKTGETLYGISKQYQVGLEDIKRWNGLDDTGIKIGQVLVLQGSGNMVAQVAKTEKNEQSITHVVATGDSLYKISKQYNVSIQDIQEWNNKKELSVSIGEVIKIYLVK